MKQIVSVSIMLILLAFSVDTTGQSVKDIEQPKENISRYPVPKVDNLPKDIQEVMLAVQEARGFVPNVLFALAHRPEEFRAFIAYNNAIMKKESGLSAAEKEMIVISSERLE